MDMTFVTIIDNGVEGIGHEILFVAADPHVVAPVLSAYNRKHAPKRNAAILATGSVNIVNACVMTTEEFFDEYFSD